MRWPCCDSMVAALDRAGTRGFSIKAADPASEELYDHITHIEFLAFDEGMDSRVDIKADIPVMIKGIMGIMFCPWCGRRVKE
jgi:hypothetical protein